MYGRWDDPRDRDDDARDVEVHWISLVQERADEEPLGRVEDGRERDGEPRDRDPRDPFLDGLDLPRGEDRELVIDGDLRYELNGDESRSLAAVGAFRVVAEDDLDYARDDGAAGRGPDLAHLRDEGLIRFVDLHESTRGVTLTDRGEHLLESHRHRSADAHAQAFYADVSRPRELAHDAELYRAYVKTEARLREDGANVRRIVLDQDLKREYQEWLQAHNRDRPDSDGRPDRHPEEIERWAREHDLPYFDGSVHFPDFRIEYERDGRERREDIEVVTEHYRGAHAAAVARCGFTCHVRGGNSRRGGRPFDPRGAEEFI